MSLCFNDTATTEIYTLSLHAALPISLRLGAQGAALLRAAARHGGAHARRRPPRGRLRAPARRGVDVELRRGRDRKSTRLNSSHANISYAVFCLKKKNHQAPAGVEDCQ